MSQNITRRSFAKTGAAATLGLPLLSELRSPETPTKAVGKSQCTRNIQSLDVRPYQLMCIVCRIGEGRTDDLGDAALTKIFQAVRQDVKLPIRLRCSVDNIYAYQNPGHEADTSEGVLFNAKRDLDILQKLGLVPGDTRPAIDMFRRLLDKVPSSKGICGYDKTTAPTWKGCPRAGRGWYEKGCAKGLGAVLPLRDEEEKSRFKTSSARAIYEAKALRIRPHHLMCMSCVQEGKKEKLAPISEDNLYEAIDVVQKNPDIPITLVPGPCMICPPCSYYDPRTNLCLGGRSMGLRDEKKDLDVLQKLGLKYGDTLPARKLFQLLFERIHSTTEICIFGDGMEHAYERNTCGGPEGNQGYVQARAANLGIK